MSALTNRVLDLLPDARLQREVADNGDRELMVLGPPGCLAGESLVVTDQGPIPIVELAGKFFMVSSLSPDGRRFAPALGFEKGRDHLYRVATTGGGFLATADHRVLVAREGLVGWRAISEVVARDALLECAAFHLLSSRDNAPSALHVDAGSWNRRRPGLTGHYSSEAAVDGGHVPPEVVDDRAFAQRQVDARARSRDGSLRDGRVAESIHTHSCRSFDHLSMRDSWDLDASLVSTLKFAPQPFGASPFSGSHLALERPPSAYGLAIEALEAGQWVPLGELVPSSSYRAASVISVHLERYDTYYDMSVLDGWPVYEAEGFWHHNTGKTRSLGVLLDAHLKAGLPPDQMLVNAFTRNATGELKRRLSGEYGLTDPEMAWVRTIHGTCFQLLRLRSEQVVNSTLLGKFGEDTGYKLEGTLGKRSVEDPYAVGSVQTLGDWCYISEELRRVSLRSVDENWEMLQAKNPTGESWTRRDARDFSETYRRWKKDNGLYDFTDMLELVLREGLRPPVKWLFLDEVQDQTPLQWKVADLWLEEANRLMTFGDPDQCQPPGTMVMVEGGGQIAIEDLDPERHRLIAYDRRSNITSGWTHGHTFQRAERPFNGLLCSVAAAERTTYCTPDHRWLVRWSPAAKEQSTNVVYLMRQGSRFRVGWCQLTRADGTFHLGVRGVHEQADAAWVLDWTTSKTDASTLESVVAAKFGLPTIPFQSVNGAKHLTQTAIDSVFDRLSNLESRAQDCLKAFGRDLNAPLWTPRTRERRGMRESLFEVRACNLLNDLMMVPVPGNDRERPLRYRVKWYPIKVLTIPYRGPVYSLRVNRHPYYIADGIITHNCIFEWSGADSTQMTKRNAHRVVLSHSYRLSSMIHGEAQGIIRRIKDRIVLDFNPHAEGGEVATSYDWMDVDVHKKEGSWLLLVRNRMYAANIRSALMESATPFYDRTSESGIPAQGSPKGLALSVLLTLHDGGFVRGGKLRLLQRQVYADDWPTDRITYNQQYSLMDIVEAGATEHLRAVISRSPLKAPRMESGDRAYLEAVFRHHGARALLDKPTTELSTIHAAKGEEADNVAVSLSMTRRTRAEYEENPDPESRVYYVAATRARSTLTWVADGPGWELNG